MLVNLILNNFSITQLQIKKPSACGTFSFGEGNRKKSVLPCKGADSFRLTKR